MTDLFNWIIQADQTVFLWINPLTPLPWLDSLMVFFSILGEGGFAGLVLALLLWSLGKPKTKITGKLILAGLASSLVIGIYILKPLIHRDRPFEILTDVRVLTNAESYSFPSGHALAAMIVAIIIWKRHPRWGWFAMIIGFLIGFSRVYNGVHFPLDVLGGFLLAALIDWMVLKFAPKTMIRG